MHHRPVAYHVTRFGLHAYQKQLNCPCHVILFCPMNYSYPIGVISWMTEPAIHFDPVPAHCSCRHGHHGNNQLTYQLTWGKPWNLTPPTCLPQLLTRYSKSLIFEFFAPTKCPVLNIVLVHIVPDVKEAAYKGLVRPVLEYGSSVWDPHTHGLQEELEKVQNRAARFVTGNYVFEIGSMTGILGQLKWESLKKRRKDSRLILLYKGLKGKARIPTDDLIPKNRRCRNQHSLAFQIPSASKEAYKSSFFPQTIRDWNDLPDSLISSAEMYDDCVSKLASLVRSRD